MVWSWMKVSRGHQGQWKRVLKLSVLVMVLLPVLHISWMSLTLSLAHHKEFDEWIYGDEDLEITKKLIRHFQRHKVKLFVLEPIFFHEYFYKQNIDENMDRLMEIYLGRKLVTLATWSKPSRTYWKNYQSSDGQIKCDSNQKRHVICQMNGLGIHVIFMKQIHDYLWISKLKDIPRMFAEYDLSVEELLIGQHDAAFDKFEIEEKDILPRPKNILYFLRQLPASKFLKCNQSNAEAFHKAYPNNTRDLKAEAKMRSAILSVKNTLKKRNALFWASDGTLLGWFRQCGIIFNTGDVDFSMNATDFTPDLLELFPKDGHGQLGDTLGQFHSGFEMRTPVLDLFLVYESLHTFWSVTFSFEPRAMYRLTYPKYTLCSAELLATKILVPCETEMVVQAEYGPNWNKLDSNFFFYQCPNLKTVQKYDEKYWKKYMYKTRDDILSAL